jgi:ssDNA-binding replication factor A large subunit
MKSYPIIKALQRRYKKMTQDKLYEWLYFDEDNKVMYSSSGEQACKYEDQTMKIRLEFPASSDGKLERDLLLDNLFPRKDNKFYKG